MIVKIHPHSDGRVLVAVVDSDLLGQKFEEGKLQIDLTADFYQGEEKTPGETGDLIRNANFVNLVGKQSVQLGIDEEVVNPDQVKHVKDVPIAMAATNLV